LIYAIRAVGTDFIKFGRANSLSRRMRELETSSPHDLVPEATAEWHNGQEKAIHAYLSEFAHKGEWFRDGDKPQQVMAWMRDKENGLTLFQAAFRRAERPGTWRYEYKRPSNLHLNARPQARHKSLPTEVAGRRAQREEWWKLNGKSIHEG
jgi:hypothetical protein